MNECYIRSDSIALSYVRLRHKSTLGYRYCLTHNCTHISVVWRYFLNLQTPFNRSVEFHISNLQTLQCLNTTFAPPNAILG